MGGGGGRGRDCNKRGISLLRLHCNKGNEKIRSRKLFVQCDVPNCNGVKFHFQWRVISSCEFLITRFPQVFLLLKNILLPHLIVRSQPVRKFSFPPIHPFNYIPPSPPPLFCTLEKTSFPVITPPLQLSTGK